MAALKSRYHGELSVGGPNLAASLVGLGLVESQTFGSGVTFLRYENR